MDSRIIVAEHRKGLPDEEDSRRDQDRMPLDRAEEVAEQAFGHLGQLHQHTRRAEHTGLHTTGEAQGATLEGDRDRGTRCGGRTRARARTREDGAVQRDARRAGPFDDQPPKGSAKAL